MVITEKKVGRIVGLAVNPKKGLRKKFVKEAIFVEDFGIKGDGHAGTFKQVSLLAIEERDERAKRKLVPGDAAENVLIEGIKDFSKINIGTKIRLGENVILQVVQIGKDCWDTCSTIHTYTGGPILPYCGVFCKVLQGGKVRVGDKIEII